MSFLSEIKNFIKTEILGVESTDTKVSTSQKKDSSPVIECKTDEPEDKFEKANEKTQENKPANDMCRKALEESLKNISAKYVDIGKLINNGLLEKVTCLSPEAFDRLSLQNKNLVIKIIKYTITRFESLMDENKINKNANLDNLISKYASNLYQALQDKNFNNIEEFEKESSDINNDLGQDFDKCSETEKKNRLKKSRENADKELKNELEEVKTLPEEEREKETARIMRRHQHIMRGRFIDISAQKDSKTAVRAMIILDSKDMEYGARTVLETRCDKEEQTKTADYVSYSLTKELINDYKNVGDIVEATSLSNFTQAFAEYKSESALLAYQAKYEADRIMYEKALIKQQNGEKLTAEEQALLSLMSNEYYTATAQGIGKGALNNINLNAEQKAEFLSNWEKTAKQFNDYQKVTAGVKKEIETNPEFAEVKEIKAKLEAKNEYTIKVESPQKEQNINITYNNGSSAKYTTTKEFNPVNLGKLQDTTEIENSKEKTTQTIKTKAFQEKTLTSAPQNNPVKIARDIVETGVEKAIETYGSDAIRIILDYSGFKHLRPQLTTIIRSYDLNTLIKVSEKCSDSSFVYICSIVNKEYVTKLTENRNQTKGLCYAAAKQIKNIEGNYESI